MPAVVLLLHQQPDGSSHFDWLIARPGCPGDSLLSYRVGTRPDDPGCSALTAEPIPDHRPFYLTYEGPITGGRGTVSRLARGTLAGAQLARDRVVLEIRWDHHAAVCDGAPAPGGLWRFTVTPSPRADR